MKKLILSIAVVLGSFTSFATSLPQVQPANISAYAEEYKEISLDKVPDAVKTALKKDFPDATLEKAYVNEKTEYKLEIAVKDQKSTVYADAAGNWLKK